MNLRTELQNCLGIWEDNNLKEKQEAYIDFSENLKDACLNAASDGYSRLIIELDFVYGEIDAEGNGVIQADIDIPLVLEYLEQFCDENNLQMHNFGVYVEVRWR